MPRIFYVFILLIGLMANCSEQPAGIKAQQARPEKPAVDKDSLLKATAPYVILDSNEIRFGKEIEIFEQLDQDSFPGKGGIVFTGSSSVRKWDEMGADLAPRRILNRGFGGSTIRQVSYYTPRIVLPYAPDTIFLYAGENDIAYNPDRPAGSTVDDFMAFNQLIWHFYPQTEIFFVSMKPSPARWKFQPRFHEENLAVREYCATDSRLHYIDVEAAMLGPDEKPMEGIWVRDKLHMNQAGYEIWADIFREVLHLSPYPRNLESPVQVWQGEEQIFQADNYHYLLGGDHPEVEAENFPDWEITGTGTSLVTFSKGKNTFTLAEQGNDWWLESMELYEAGIMPLPHGWEPGLTRQEILAKCQLQPDSFGKQWVKSRYDAPSEVMDSLAGVATRQFLQNMSGNTWRHTTSSHVLEFTFRGEKLYKITFRPR